MKKQYYILQTQNFYGPKQVRSLVSNDQQTAPWTGSYAEAKAEIAERDGCIYYTAHGEAGRSELKIVGCFSQMAAKYIY